jgi:ATP-dependent protease ClpP protease subunit
MTIPKLLQLARDNAAASKPLRAESSGAEATVYLHGVIGGFWGDIDETEFVKALSSIKADTIHLRIDSPGGDVFGARAMMTAIAQHPAKVVAHVDGLAASAATGICTACDEIEITQGAGFMIHNAWSVAIGNKADMRKTGDLLEKIDGDLVNDYARRTGRDASEIANWMDEETWFTADEAVANGFADRKVEVVKDRTKNTWNLSAYNHAPKPEPEAADVDDVAAHRNALERRLALLERAPA